MNIKNLRAFFTRYRHGLLALLYMPFYLLWFFYLEKTVTRRYQVIHMAVDDYIPFCEFFIIPYYLWFAYVVITVVCLLLLDKSEYYRSCAYLFTGMTIFLIISTLWPNGQHLRPYVMPRENLFTQMVEALYRSDTPTNIWPSIHVFNSIGAHIAICRCRRLKEHKGIRISSLILAVSIILSTVFLKQHSVFDVLTAFVMALVLYPLVYRREVLLSWIQNLRSHRKIHRHYTEI